jgi:hypothetical protein
VALGDADRAFSLLQRACDEREPALLWAQVDPRLDPVRTDPRFQQLVARIGIPE